MTCCKQLLVGAMALAGGSWATLAICEEPAAKRPSSPFRLVQFPGNAKPDKHSYTDDGIVSEVTPNSITVVAKKKLWVLYPQPGCVVEVTGEAELGYLKPGMLVRIYGDFDKRYKATAPIEQLEIVSLQTPNVTPGVFPNTLPPVDEKDKAKKAEEEKPKEAADKPDKDEANAKPSEEPGKPMMIVGQLKVLKDGELLIAAGNRTVRAQLAEEPEIRVSLTDFRLAKRGDAMKKFHCEYYQTGIGVTDLLTIEITNPLAGPKKPVRKPTAKPVAKQPAKDGGKAK